jgi:hypothetical protein
MPHRPHPKPCQAERSTRRQWLTGSLAALATPAWCLDSAAPGKVVLTVTGRITRPNAGNRAEFDMAALAALPQTRFSTHTPWEPQERRFTGPLLRDVLALAGAQGSLLKAKALNDYRVDIPVSDSQRFDVIVARLLDDQPMRVRDRGPLFVIYPFDSDGELRAQRYFARSVWQLCCLDVQ